MVISPGGRVTGGWVTAGCDRVTVTTCVLTTVDPGMVMVAVSKMVVTTPGRTVV